MVNAKVQGRSTATARRLQQATMQKKASTVAQSRRRPRENNPTAEALRVSHLRRDVKTALELAVAALARTDLIDALATAAGLLEALAEFPKSSAPVVAMLPRATQLADDALLSWRNWQSHPARKRSA
jgi:hypothetical protein